MKDKHIIDTANSIWTLDTLSMMMTRIPRSEAMVDHPKTSYDDVGRPEEFIYAHAEYNNIWHYICIHLQEMSHVFPERHRRMRTGEVSAEVATQFRPIGEPEGWCYYPSSVEKIR